MSTKRAITQLVKDYAASSKKLHVLEEEKAAALKVVSDRYEAKELDLQTKRSEAHNALLALGLSADTIEKAVKELAAESASEKK